MYLFSVSSIAKLVVQVSDHSIICDGSIMGYNKTNIGLCAKIQFKCVKCEIIYFHNKSPAVDINNLCVLGSMCVGIGYQSTKTFLSILGANTMSENLYSKLQTIMADKVKKFAEKNFAENINAEKSEAEATGLCKNGNFDIAAIGDAQWSKRSFDHSFTANSCVGVGWGATKKILYLGIKNKYCSVCSRNPGHQHTCYKNWTKSKAKMESNIILEGIHEISVEKLFYS